jgi:hypothetical protein
MTGAIGMMFGNRTPPVIVQGGGGVSSASADMEPRTLARTLQGNWGGSNPTGTGNFTAECWIYNTNKHDNQMIFETRNDSGGAGFGIRTLTDGAVNNGFMYIYGGGTAQFEGLVQNQWMHIAVSRSSNTTKIFLDGTQKISITDNGNYNSNNWRVGGYWGIYNNYEVLWVFEGYIDEVRYSSTARYTANFTPQTSSFTSDGDTLLLLHMDGENGGTTFTDDSSYARTGITATGGLTTNTSVFKF